MLADRRKGKGMRGSGLLQGDGLRIKGASKCRVIKERWEESQKRGREDS